MRLTAKDRKRIQREKEKKDLATKGGFRLIMLCYGETERAIEELCKHHGFTGQQRRAECITHIIHQAHDQLGATK